MLALEEVEWKVYRKSLYYFCNSSVNPSLFQNKNLKTIVGVVLF